jgi:hypothetical protein
MTLPGFEKLSAVLSTVVAVCFSSLLVGKSWAITGNQLQDFQSGASQWSVSNGAALVPVLPDEGPAGAGDFALHMSSSELSVPRLLVINTSEWDGNWTAAGIFQISMDVRNPNNFDLAMRLGIAGPGGVSSGGSGDTHVTQALSVAPDNAWHTLTFNVAAANFTALESTSTAAALANVSHFRIIHNPSASFIGAFVQGAFDIDNIRAIAPDPIAGDYNSNGAVDAADYVVWRNTLNQMGAALPADGTADGKVDNLDYNFWRARFGTVTGAGTSVPLSLAVPEPAAWPVLLVIAAFRRKSR